jgi:hypothetical protein
MSSPGVRATQAYSSSCWRKRVATAGQVPGRFMHSRISPDGSLTICKPTCVPDNLGDECGNERDGSGLAGFRPPAPSRKSSTRRSRPLSWSRSLANNGSTRNYSRGVRLFTRDGNNFADSFPRAVSARSLARCFKVVFARFRCWPAQARMKKEWDLI